MEDVLNKYIACMYPARVLWGDDHMQTNSFEYEMQICNIHTASSCITTRYAQCVAMIRHRCHLLVELHVLLFGPTNRISSLGLAKARFDQWQVSQSRLELTTRKSFTAGVEGYPASQHPTCCSTRRRTLLTLNEHAACPAKNDNIHNMIREAEAGEFVSVDLAGSRPITTHLLQSSSKR